MSSQLIFKRSGNSEYCSLILRDFSSNSQNFRSLFLYPSNDEWSEQTKDIAILFSNENNDDKFRLILFNAWPVNYTLGGVYADITDFQIEEIEFAFRYFELESLV